MQVNITKITGHMSPTDNTNTSDLYLDIRPAQVHFPDWAYRAAKGRIICQGAVWNERLLPAIEK